MAEPKPHVRYEVQMRLSCPGVDDDQWFPYQEKYRDIYAAMAKRDKLIGELDGTVAMRDSPYTEILKAMHALVKGVAKATAGKLETRIVKKTLTIEVVEQDVGYEAK